MEVARTPETSVPLSTFAQCIDVGAESTSTLIFFFLALSLAIRMKSICGFDCYRMGYIAEITWLK
jgi:hypothetical protein